LLSHCLVFTWYIAQFFPPSSLTSLELEVLLFIDRVICQFVCLGVWIHTLAAAICYDQYEAFTKLPAERTFSVSRAKKLYVIIWLYVTITTLLSFTGNFVAFYFDGHVPFSLSSIGQKTIEQASY